MARGQRRSIAVGSMCVIAPWPHSWPHTRLLWRSRLVRASSVVLSGWAVACVACCCVEVCRVVRDGLSGCGMGAVTCFCVSPGIGSRCHVVFSPVGGSGVLPTPRQAWGTLPQGAQHPSRLGQRGDGVPKHGRSWAQTCLASGGSGRGDPQDAGPCWGCAGGPQGC